MKTIQFTNEKGNVSVQARNQVRGMVSAQILSTLESNPHFEGVFVNDNGGYSIPVALTTTGETIYAHLDLTISTNQVSKQVRKPKAKAPTTAVAVPNLFE